MRKILLVAMLAGIPSFWNPAWGQAPGIGKEASKNQKKQAALTTKEAKADKRGTKDFPIFVDEVGQQKNTEQTAKEERENYRKALIDRWTLGIALLGALFTGALVVVGWCGLRAANRTLRAVEAQARIMQSQHTAMRDQLTEMKESTQAAKDGADAAKQSASALEKQIVLEQRPRIEVSAFYFRNIDTGYFMRRGIQDGSVADGQFYIRNSGGTRATIREIWCKALILDKLPMRRPYEGEIGSQRPMMLEAGQSFPFLFALDELDRLDSARADSILRSNTFFFVLGWIGYVDDIGIYRIRHFCRRYDVFMDRIVPADDPDYERED